MKHRPARWRLVKYPTLLQQRRRIAQGAHSYEVGRWYDRL